MCALLLFCIGSAYAQSSSVYTIRVQEADGTPVENVEIHGNHGIRHLAAPFTDSRGERQIYTTELLTANPTVVLAHENYVFDPPEFALSDVIACRDRVCSVTAIPDSSCQP